MKKVFSFIRRFFVSIEIFDEGDLLKGSYLLFSVISDESKKASSMEMLINYLLNSEEIEEKLW